jgi:hypothetical protein
VLDDPTIPLIRDSGLRYASTVPLAHGTVSVEIERTGCGIVTGITDPDGKYSVEGAAYGNVSIRLRPIDRPDLITTIHHLADSNGIEYPILTRAALEGVFAATNAPGTPDPAKAQIVLSFFDHRVPPGIPVSGGTIVSTGARGTIAYEDANASGSLGLAAVVNAATEPYPGETTSITALFPGAPSPSPGYVAIAPDAVSLILVGPR